MNLEQIKGLMASKGVKQLLFKILAPNDNSKNQIYVAGSLDILNVIPMKDVRSVTTRDGFNILNAKIDLNWIASSGHLTKAPNAQLILYPQYPEVRLSGFLRGAIDAPNSIMASREHDRVLFLGITQHNQIIAYAERSTSLVYELSAIDSLQQTGAFSHLPIGTADTSRTRLLEKLAEVASAGWMPAQRLASGGLIVPCRGTNCGGYTLEAQLGITPNGKSEPDYEGWELKSHNVTNFDRLGVGQLTLMTPEPTGGLYKSEGPGSFVRKFGYADLATDDRLNFSSPHRAWRRNERTKLTLVLSHYDRERERITDPHGSFALLTDRGEIAAEWHYASLLAHWNRKHDKAAYVPSMSSRVAPIHYRYGSRVRLGSGTDFERFLSAVSSGVIWYDPGIKLEGASTTNPRVKRRNQFRVRSADLAQMYERFEDVGLISV